MPNVTDNAIENTIYHYIPNHLMYFHIISELSFFGKLKVDEFNGMFERSNTKYNRFEFYSHFDCSYYSELKYAFIEFQEYFT